MPQKSIALIAVVLVAVSVLLLRPGAADPAARPLLQVDPPALRPAMDARRLVVLLADNAGTETTDLLVPHGILARSGAADVRIVATTDGPVQLMPALTVLPDMTLAEFERRHPGGADAVIVPAFHSRGTEATSGFIRDQAAKGAMIVAVCEGSEPVARAGLFDGRVATTHWFAQDRMARRYPEASWVQNTRYVIDGPVISSSGVSASVPVTLKLLEILAGAEVAQATATELGLEGYGPDHDSARFSLDFGQIRLAVSNLLAFWRKETVYADVSHGLDGVAFALQADAWSRTYRSQLVARNALGRITSGEGVVFLTETEGQGAVVIRPASGPPLQALDANLAAISSRYGCRTAHFVANQLEYAWNERCAGAGLAAD